MGKRNGDSPGGDQISQVVQDHFTSSDRKDVYGTGESSPLYYQCLCLLKTIL